MLTLKQTIVMLVWVYWQSIKARLTGFHLTNEELDWAKKVGVANPKKIRIKFVKNMPEVPSSLRAISESNLNITECAGLTLGYAVLIRENLRQFTNKRLFSHEFRHVYQVEQAGSIAKFLYLYIGQVLEFGYHNAPLEKDAVASELA